MRKTLLVVVASGALIALTPATALAKHHSRHHRAHHARVHHRRIGDPASPTTTPSPAGTVASFTGGVLTITLADGSTVSGMVTNDTRLECVASASTGEDQGDDQGDQGGDQSGGDQSGGDQSGGDQSGGDQSQGDDDQGQGDDESNQMCTTANLVSPTPVLAAELSITGAGSAWEKVVLMTTPSTTPLVPDTDNDGS